MQLQTLLRAKVAEDVTAIKEKELDNAAVNTTISVTKITANAATIETRKAPADYGALDGKIDAGADVDALTYERTAIPIMVTDNEVINDKQANIRRKDLIDSLIKGKYNLKSYAVPKIFTLFS